MKVPYSYRGMVEDSDLNVFYSSFLTLSLARFAFEALCKCKQKEIMW
jgi:hypothetical protein